MRRIFAQVRKELTQMVRDRLTLVLAIVLPAALTVLLGTALSLSVKNLPVAVADESRTPISRAYADTVAESRTFHQVPLPIGTHPDHLLLTGQARAVIVIRELFARDVLRGRPVSVQWLVDAADSNTANIVRGAASALTDRFSATLGTRASPVVVQTRFWHNPGLDPLLFSGSGIVAVILALFPPLFPALSMSREVEQKTILQVYVSSISAAEYLAGKFFAYVLVAFAEWVVCLGLAILIFHLRLAGDPMPLLICTPIYLLCCVAFGIMIGVVIPDQASAIQAVQMVGFLLSFLLSGFIFATSNIPPAIRWLSAVVPARYYIDVLRDAFLRGAGWPAVWSVPFVLTGITAIFLLVAWSRMRPMQLAT